MHIFIFADLGYQSAQRIVQASDPLHTMQEINQNFPNLVSSLSRMKVCFDSAPYSVFGVLLKECYLVPNVLTVENYLIFCDDF